VYSCSSEALGTTGAQHAVDQIDVARAFSSRATLFQTSGESLQVLTRPGRTELRNEPVQALE
jgi:hypothetical protein